MFDVRMDEWQTLSIFWPQNIHIENHNVTKQFVIVTCYWLLYLNQRDINGK